MPEVGVEIMKGDRAFYIAKTVNIGRLTPATTIAHEITHGTEIQNPATLAASRAFLKSRRKPGEKTVKLRNLFPGNGYEPWEITIEDDFAPKGGHAYSGKIYSPGIGNTELRQTWIKALKTDPDGAFGILEATELLTMGIERLQRDPIAFALEDRDYFNFTLTTLQKLEP